MELSQSVYNPLPIKRWALFITLAVLLSLLLFFFALWSPILLGVVSGAVFVAVFITSRTFRWNVFIAVLALNNFLIIRLGLLIQFGGLAIQPLDVVAILLAGSVVVQRLISGQRLWVQTELDRAIWLFLGAIACSLLGAPNLKAGIVGWGHHFLYFFAFYAMVADWKDVPLKNIWRTLVLWTVLAALSAIWQFLSSEGGRALSFGGIAFLHLILPLFCIQLAGFSIWNEARRWLFLGALILAITATQTRGVWLGAVVVLLVWLVSGYLVERAKAQPFAKRVAFGLVKIGILLFLLFMVLTPFLGQSAGRAKQLETHAGTVYLRLFLWGEALRLFLEHPINGIGLGQFAGEVARIPETKNLAVFVHTRGLTAHNLFLSFLAETGLIGVTALLVLFLAPVRLAWKGIQRARTLNELYFGWGLFLYFAYLAVAVFFAGSWEYYFTFFLAFLVLFTRKLQVSPEVR